MYSCLLEVCLHNLLLETHELTIYRYIVATVHGKYSVYVSN